MCLETVPRQPHLNRSPEQGSAALKPPTLGPFHVALCLLASGLESPNAFSIWQPLAQFPAVALWRLEDPLSLWKITPSLWKSPLLSLFPKPTSLAASTGAASDFLRGLYPHMNGGDSGDAGIPWHYKKKKVHICLFSGKQIMCFFPSDFQKIPEPKKDSCPKELVHSLVL